MQTLLLCTVSVPLHNINSVLLAQAHRTMINHLTIRLDQQQWQLSNLLAQLPLQQNTLQHPIQLGMNQLPCSEAERLGELQQAYLVCAWLTVLQQHFSLL